MKKILIYTIILFVTLPIQTALIGMSSYLSYAINLPLFLILYANWSRPGTHTFIFSFFTGITVDFISSNPFGFHTFLFLLISLLIQYLALNKITNIEYGSLGIAVVTGIVSYNLLLLLLTPYFIDTTQLILSTVVSRALLQSFFGSLLLLIFHTYNQRHAKYRQKSFF